MNYEVIPKAILAGVLVALVLRLGVDAGRAVPDPFAFGLVAAALWFVADVGASVWEGIEESE